MKEHVVGAAMIVKRNRKVFLLQRADKGSFPLTWCIPGGKVKPGESFEKAAIREETGIEVRSCLLLGEVYYETSEKTYNIMALESSGPGQIMEKDKAIDCRWVKQSRLPAARNLIPALRLFVERYPRLWHLTVAEINTLKRLHSNRILVWSRNPVTGRWIAHWKCNHVQ